MAITTDFIGHIGIEPALSGEQIGHLSALRAAARGDGRPPFTSGWVASADGRSLTVEGDDRYGDPAEWLRHLIKLFTKPSGLRADGMVVGCRRDTKELSSIHVAANRVSERALWPRAAQSREVRHQPPPRKPAAQVIDLASRRARA
jgi:hypothetical protein